MPTRSWVGYFASLLLRLSLDVIPKTDLALLHLLSRNL